MSSYYQLLRKQCGPVQIHVVLSLWIIVGLLFQNLDTAKNQYCMGNKTCELRDISKSYIIFMKIFYAVLWTFIYYYMCSYSTTLTWVFIISQGIVGILGVMYLIHTGVLK